MNNFKEISVSEAKEILNEDIYLIDIRDQDSFDKNHIDGAVCLSNNNVDDFVNSADKKKKTVIYCYKGNSSKNAAEYFCSIGFQIVYSLEGGYELWSG